MKSGILLNFPCVKILYNVLYWRVCDICEVWSIQLTWPLRTKEEQGASFRNCEPRKNFCMFLHPKAIKGSRTSQWWHTRILEILLEGCKNVTRYRISCNLNSVPLKQAWTALSSCYKGQVYRACRGSEEPVLFWRETSPLTSRTVLSALGALKKVCASVAAAGIQDT